MKHHIKADSLGRMATIIWDDQAGTVTGDHYQLFGEHGLIEDFERVKKEGTPYQTGSEVDYYILQDIRHNPADFLSLLGFATCGLKPPRCILPASLQGIKPTGAAGAWPCPEGAIQ